MTTVDSFLALILSAWLTASGFHDNFTCTVKGYVYTLPPDPPTLTRQDGCSQVKTYLDDTTLVLWNDYYWVVVPVPQGLMGQVPFWYPWGSPMAHLRETLIPVQWGFVRTG